LNDQVSRLIEFSRRVEEAFGDVGFAREQRPLSAHLTLGRLKRDVHPSERAAIGETVQKFRVENVGAMDARAVHLIRSELRPSGPIYSTIATVDLHDPLSRPP